MILHKETYEKYGYSYKKLTKSSQKSVIVQCENCNEIYSQLYKNYNLAKTNFCRKCHNKINLPLIKKERRSKLLQLYKNEEISLEYKLQLLKFSSMYLGRAKSPILTIGGKTVTVKETMRILGALKCVKIPNNTKEFKCLIIDNISLDYWKLYQAICLWTFSGKYRLYNNSIDTRITCWEYGELLSRFPTIKYRQEKLTKYNGSIHITKGAFFINNRWVYIGE